MGFPTKKKRVRYAVVLVLLTTESRNNVWYPTMAFCPNGSESTVVVPTWETEKNKRTHRFRKFLFVHNPEKEGWYKVHKIKA